MAIQELRLVITVSDYERAQKFFEGALGLERLAEFHNNGGRGLLLAAGRATLEIFDEAQAAAIDEIEVGRRAAGQFRIALGAADSEGIASDLVKAGAEVIGGPVTTPWGDRNVRVVAPDGIQMTLFSPSA